jgi:hypothetical protein
MMASHFPSWRDRVAACAAGLGVTASTSALAAPIDIHWPEITFTWPPSPPDMLLIGSGIVLVLALLFALIRSGSGAHKQHAPQGTDLRWWKNPPDPRDHVDPMSMPR